MLRQLTISCFHDCALKAALNMMTRTSAAEYVKTSGIYMTAVDTGWVSYYSSLFSFFLNIKNHFLIAQCHFFVPRSTTKSRWTSQPSTLLRTISKPLSTRYLWRNADLCSELFVLLMFLFSRRQFKDNLNSMVYERKFIFSSTLLSNLGGCRCARAGSHYCAPDSAPKRFAAWSAFGRLSQGLSKVRMVKWSNIKLILICDRQQEGSSI